MSVEDEREDVLLRKAGPGALLEIHVTGKPGNVRRLGRLVSMQKGRVVSNPCRHHAEMLEEIERLVQKARW